MKIIIVNGFPQSGKTLFCELAYQNRGRVYYYSTIDKVKQLAKWLGWNGHKDEKGRRFLSDLKDALTRYNDLPTQFVIEQIRFQLEAIESWGSDNKNAIFLVQMREPEEIKRWKEDFGARALLINRPETTNDKPYGWHNHADDLVLCCDYEYKLVNNGRLNDWTDETCKFIDMLRKEDWESHV